MSVKSIKNKSKSKPYFVWVILVGIVLFVIAMILTSVLTASPKPVLANESDVQKLQNIVKNITLELQNKEQEWKDVSSCTILESRFYGEEDKYYCSVSYERKFQINNQKDIDNIIQGTAKRIKNVKIVQELGRIVYPRFASKESSLQVGSISFKINEKFADTQKCIFEYNTTAQEKNVLNEVLKCRIDTDGTYLPNVRTV